MNEIVVREDGFYVSYNGDITSDPLGSMLDGILLSMAGKDHVDSSETALCVKNNGKLSGYKYLILYGDHRQQYREAALKGGLSACLDYFNAHRDQASHASEHEPIEAKFA